MRRYQNTNVIGLNYRYATSFAIPNIRKNVLNGNIVCQTIILQENDRLDILAGKYLGDGKLWWILAACSQIGWVCQVPPGTIIKIPKLNDVANYL